jgi:hypothetical protein
MFARRKGLWWEYFSIAGKRWTIIVFSELDAQMSSRHTKKHCQIDRASTQPGQAGIEY